MQPRQTYTQPRFRIGFCQEQQVAAIGVLLTNGVYYYYSVNHKKGQLQPLQCITCQPQVFEKNLHPCYSVFVERLYQHIIFVYNDVTDSIEQYIFNNSTGGFEQIDYPELQYRQNTPSSEVICTIQGDNKHAMTLIQKDDEGCFRKFRYINSIGGYALVPPVAVKTLMIQKFESGLLFQEEQNEVQEELPIPAPGSFIDVRPFIIQFCSRLNEHIISIRLQTGAYRRVYYNRNTGKFVEIECEDCQTKPREQDLHPIYTVYHAGIGKHVVFMKNYKNFMVEQYIYIPCGSFEQVHVPDLPFNPNHQSADNLCFVTENPADETPIRVQRSRKGGVEKLNNVGKGKVNVLRPTTVITFAVRQKMLEAHAKKEEERNYIKNFPYDDYQDEWAAKSFMKFITSSSFEDSGSLSMLNQKYQELITEIQARADRSNKYKAYDTARYNNIINQKVGEIEEIESILKKNMPYFVPEWEGSELATFYGSSSASSSSTTVVKNEGSDSGLSEDFAKVTVNEVM